MSSTTTSDRPRAGLGYYVETFLGLAARQPRILIMMFLQYFIWGLWLPILPLKLQTVLTTPEMIERLGADGAKQSLAWPIALIMTCYGFGSILGPFLIGQLADRYFAAEKVLCAAHVVGGVLLILTASQTTFWPIMLLLFLYCNLYMPTMGLTNSVAFKALGDDDRAYFAWVRNLGTIGWIAAGFFFAWYLNQFNPKLALECLRVSGIISIVYGIYCLFLPSTPPSPAKASDGLEKRSATLECLQLLKDRSFLVLFLVAGLIGIMLAFYFGCEGYFLADLGLSENNVGMYMTLGQFVEMLVMVSVPVAIKQFGMKWTMIIGALFWAARFGLSMLGQPLWLMVATIGFHGFCFGFFFVVAFMYVDKAAPKDIRSTAQNLLVFIIYGFGTVVGNMIVGPLRERFGSNWLAIWSGPFVLTLASVVLFALFFNPSKVDVAEFQEAAHP